MKLSCIIPSFTLSVDTPPFSILSLAVGAALMVMTSSCEKELDFVYNDIPPMMVVDGALTPDGVSVALRCTTPMDEPMDRTPLTDASVFLDDVTSGSSVALMPDEDGNFTDARPGVVGHEYRLRILRDGGSYEMVTPMYAAVEIRSLEFNWIKMPYDNVAVLQGKFTDDATTDGDCYWVRLYRNGEIYTWAEMDDRTAEDGICTFTLMTSRQDTDEEDDDTVLVDGDVVTCTVYRISRAMHDYLEALKNGSNGPRLFTGGVCLGYFMATSPVSRSVTFRPDEIEFYE